MVGSFKAAKGGFTHIFVAVDKFIKWIEAKSAAYIMVAKAVEFVLVTMCRFDITNNIISDNGTQFIASDLRDFCDDAGIRSIMLPSRVHKVMDKSNDPMT
jgi:hypothetical protein